MDKPQIKLQLNRHSSNRPQETSALSSDTCESFTPLPGRTQRQASGGLFASLFGQNHAGKMKILAPLLLATLTGVLLGVCLLVLFRGQTPQPTVTTVQPDQGQGNPVQGQTIKGAAQMPGQTLWTWQLASFKDQTSAQKAQQEFAAKGIHATMRQIGSTYQLLVGMAADKKSGEALEAVLNKMKITYYAKPFSIDAHNGFINGMKEQDAKALTDGLGQEAKLATEAMQLVKQATPDAKLVAGLKQQFDSLQAEEKNWHNAMVQAGLNGEAAQLESTHKQLADSITALQTTGNVLNVQSKLTAFFVNFETLSGQLVKSE